MKIKQYIPTYLEMPALGEVREVVNRTGDVKIVAVCGVYPLERKVLLREINTVLEWKGCLMDKLNKGQFESDEWADFIDLAETTGYKAVADDMRKRKEYYDNQK